MSSRLKRIFEVSKTVTTIGLIVVAIALFLLGMTLGTRFRYSQFAAVTFGLVPALLVIFPLIRGRYGEKVTFGQWATVVFLSALFATVINNVLSRFS